MCSNGCSRIVAGRRALGRKSRHRGCRRNQIVDPAEHQRREPAQLEGLVEAANDVTARELRAAFSPFERVGVDFVALLGGPRFHVGPRTRAEECVDSFKDCARDDALHRLDDCAFAGEEFCRRFDRGLHLGIDRHPGARIEQQPDPLALQTARQVHPVDVLHRQAHAVAVVGLRQDRHHQRGVVHGARHWAGAARDERRVDRDAAEARLEANEAAPSGGQAHRAADIGADMQRAIAGRARRARA